nr:MAG TPA: hypothetical protein [Caudoviricetes sp.]
MGHNFVLTVPTKPFSKTWSLQVILHLFSKS